MSQHNALFTPEQIKKGISVSSGMIKNSVIIDIIYKYLINKVEIVNNEFDADFTHLSVETLRIKGHIFPMALSPFTKRIEYKMEDTPEEQIETKGIFEYNCQFYNNTTFNSAVEFKRKAIFYNDVIFKKGVKFNEKVIFNGSAIFYGDAQFLSLSILSGETKFKSNVIFENKVKGNEVIFDKQCEFWVKPEIKHPQHIHLMPEEMFIEKNEYNPITISLEEERSKEKKRNKEKKTWWGETINKKKENKHQRKDFYFINEEENNEEEGIENISDEVKQKKKLLEQKKIDEKLLSLKRNKEVSENDLRNYIHITQLELESKGEIKELSLLIPSSITLLEIKGKIPLNRISETINENFNVHPIELRLSQCVIPLSLPFSIKSLSLKQCDGNVSCLKTLPLHSLYIQNFHKLVSLSVPSTLTRLELIGIPTLTTVDGDCPSIKTLKIHMCIKLMSIQFPSSIQSVDLATCPQIIQKYKSLSLTPTFLKINNKVLTQ
ncbi:hypothetical protein EDI_092850 [Entamoeba dispar SAW760]|uniref:Uncharacterized protein n=1 Tax=Entamoeba dispar (strain ATCC PRA-260 / SAW760) TaxID=370354 RepID=B0ED77_ENTDS|nr:uncharacterized protein EDI_092850 [Entamoeba dispar SAW760]EDR27494.1 hypothetical protein EDI_092850 [Entamoeba dispar SAW760]|eukprot:EDR27494.1 hypothetical protein EDI_092850 [Entamoeba dispar SAW760]